jgi:hypothetical protein
MADPGEPMRNTIALDGPATKVMVLSGFEAR